MRRIASRLLSVVLCCAALPSVALAGPSRLLASSPQAQVHLRAGTSSPSLITGLDVALPVGDRVEAIRALLEADAAFLGFDPALSSLEARRPQTAGRLTVYRFGQRHQGLPVLGADVAVTVDDSGHVRIIGSALELLGQLPAAFEVSAERASSLAVGAVRPRRWSGAPRMVRQAVAGVAGEWRAVWEVQLVTSEPLGSFHVWVDAASGQVLQATNHFRNMKQGYAFLDCPESGSRVVVDLANLQDDTGLLGLYADLYSNCTPGVGGDCRAADRIAKPDGNGDYFIEPNEGSVADGFAEVHTFYHLNQMHDWFKATGFTGLDFALPVSVNYSPNPDYYGYSCNAGYGDDMIVVGLCDTSMLGYSGYVNFAYDSLSVMHEYTHGAVDHGANFANYATDTWGLVGQQMGLHEGFADFFPAVVLDDPMVGRHVGPKIGSGAYMRTLTDFRSCPANLVGEPHEDGQIWGSANWEAYVASSKSPELPLAVFEGLLTLSTKPTFADAASAVLAAAALSHPSVSAALEDAYLAHGVTGCGREILIASGEKVTGTLYNPGYFGLSNSTMPFLAQYKVLVPQNATSLAFTLRGTEGTSTSSSVRFYINANSNVQYKASGMTATAVKTSSYTMANPAPGAYYVLPVGTNFGWSTESYGFELTATVTGGDAYDGGFPWYADAGTPGPDAARPGADAAHAGPDAASAGPDAETAGPDAGTPGPDATAVVVGPDAEVIPVADAAAPAGPDAAAVETDAGGAVEDEGGCGCGLAGTRDPAASAFVLVAGLAFVSTLRPRRRE